ncbi:MAG TPA: hypothetical protein VI959_01855, partial [Alphaproteobacteria bacterium]|nr:hypothetical protein [Alphaproteobacteria bacterium]
MSALFAFKPVPAPLTGFKRKLKLIYQNTPFYKLHLSKSPPSYLNLTPMDPWPGQVMIGQQLCEGFLNVKEDLYMVSNFWQDCEDNTAIGKDLYAFHFLRDLRSVGDSTSRRLARDLILSWIDEHPNWKHASWEIEPLTQRIYNWLALFDFYGSSAENSCHKIIFKSLLKQARHLVHSISLCSNGFLRFQALKSLLFLVICFEKDITSKKSNFDILLKHLEKESVSLCLNDGCVQSRNPYKQVLFLKDLIDIRTILRQAQLRIPEFLQQRIELVTPIVRFFRHGDGGISNLAQRHSLTPSFIDTILSLSDVKHPTPLRLVKGGYERLAARHSIVIVNTGPRSTNLPVNYLATGCLNFEWSVGAL